MGRGAEMIEVGSPYALRSTITEQISSVLKSAFDLGQKTHSENYALGQAAIADRLESSFGVDVAPGVLLDQLEQMISGGQVCEANGRYRLRR